MIRLQLKPHPILDQEQLLVEGLLSRYGTELSLGLSVHSKARTYAPELNPAATRERGLWNSTCIELFVKNPKGSDYFEWNLAPNGSWNCFYFVSERTPLEGDLYEWPEVKTPLFTHSHESDSLWRFNASLTLPTGVEWTQHVGLPFGVSAMILTEDKTLPMPVSLHHPKDVPDFHHPESFVGLI